MNARKFFHQHPRLAERAALALCEMNADKVTGDWRRFLEVRRYRPVGGVYQDVKEIDHRRAPLPFSWWGLGGSGLCQLCGFEIFKHGDWRARAGKRHPMSSWHACCGDVANTMRGTLNWKFFAGARAGAARRRARRWSGPRA